MAFDFKTVGKNDQIALVAGAAAVLLTLFPWYATFSVDSKDESLGSLGGSESINAWHQWALLGVFLLIAAFVIVVLRVVVGNVLPAGVPWNLVTAAAAGLGTLLLLFYPFTFGPDVPSIVEDSIDVSKRPGWSGVLLLIAAVVFTVFSAIAFKESGEKIPEFNKPGGTTTPPPAAPTAQPTAPPAAAPAPPAAPPAPPAAPAAETPPPAPPAPPADTPPAPPAPPAP